MIRQVTAGMAWMRGKMSRLAVAKSNNMQGIEKPGKQVTGLLKP